LFFKNLLIVLLVINIRTGAEPLNNASVRVFYGNCPAQMPAVCSVRGAPETPSMGGAYVFVILPP
jgi:hypothetical protein